ncbi:hypothetical protein BDA99DRAFT_508737 [Phascolomyces articulosus]|uniref:Uncharacterized protein n=1 Tax=Phascolomyces articulosus TaxID=60185 RepID=A0AAD5PEA2_9FUNG|nr:hypothetical protein BDA99DRAFT_508737 [Phascolomyces articulosus]
MERTTASTATFSDQPPVDNDKMTTLSIVQIRDTEHFQLVRLVTEMTLLQEEGMDMSYNVKTRWTALTLRQVNKYRWLMILGNLRHLTFGYCHTWPAEVWKQAVLPRCSTLESLELHGWMGLHHGTQQYQRYNSSNRLLIQKEAEDAIVSCFGALSDQLQSLILVDFWVTGKMKISSTSAHAPYRDSQQPNSLSPMRRKKILLKYTLESFQEEKYPIDHMLNDIHDFILYHQSQGHDVKLELDPQWKMYHQRWLLLQK